MSESRSPSTATEAPEFVAFVDLISMRYDFVRSEYQLMGLHSLGEVVFEEVSPFRFSVHLSGCSSFFARRYCLSYSAIEVSELDSRW